MKIFAKVLALFLIIFIQQAYAQSVDATSKLSASVTNNGLKIQVNNDVMGGDPAPRVTKELHVSYTIGGVPHDVTIREGGSLELPLDSDGIGNLLIVKAEYGTKPAKPDMYPPLPAAQDSINWKDGYFYINGKPTFLTSGEMHYARIPHELWRDRIWRAKQMGFNCMQMYVFWNATEGKEGQWDFSDNLDLDAWLTMVQDAGMYAVVRVGPYSCAEWDDGGIPAWLTVKPGMTLRDSGPAFDSYVDQHLAQVEKIVAKHQINHGGNVLMVQLENEHPKGWGTDDNDPYLRHLVDQARTNGLEIPLFLSGDHHGSDPSGERPYTPGPNPWYTTEFWTGWIGKYGDMDTGMLDEKIRGTWKIIAFGGGGYDYYMVHGGTNFGYSGNSLDATYDYSAPIGETGQFHNFYYPARRAAYFAQSFSPLLTGSHNDPDFAKADIPSLRVTTRTNPTGGSIVFIDNFSKKADASQIPEIAPTASSYKASIVSASTDVVPTHLSIGGLILPHQGSLNIRSSEPSTVIVNLPWSDSATFESICTNVLLRKTLGTIDYWVCYGNPGETGEVTLQRKRSSSAPTQFDFTYPTDDTVKEIDIDSGDQHQAKLLVMNTALTNKTWLSHDKLYVGASFVLEDGSVEFPPEGGKAVVYSVTGKTELSHGAQAAPALPLLSFWTWRDASEEKSPDFNTAGWIESQGPQPMESYDSFQNRYGWYRTKLHCDSAGPVSLHFGGQSGTFAVFLNGEPSSFDNLKAKAGDNSLAILTKAWPRGTLYLYTGPIGNRTAQGLWGGVSTNNTSTKPDVDWKRWADSENPGNLNNIAKPDYDDSTWQPVDATETIQCKKGASFFRGEMTLKAEEIDSTIHISTFGTSTIYLNGQRLDSSTEDVSKILVTGKNTLLLKVLSKEYESGKLEISLWRNSPLTNAKWLFHGGLEDLRETPVIGRVTNWNDFLTKETWQSGNPATPHLPTFWKSTFDYHHPVGMRETIGLLTDGLKSGHVWLNGHNLGECPQKIPIYMPECWLKDGANDLVIFDFFGNEPSHVQLTRYQAFSVVEPQ